MGKQYLEMYDTDIFSVARASKGKDKDGATIIFDEVLLYENLPCHIIVKNGDEYSLQIRCSIEYDIKKNDKIVAIKRTLDAMGDWIEIDRYEGFALRPVIRQTRQIFIVNS